MQKREFFGPYTLVIAALISMLVGNSSVDAAQEVKVGLIVGGKDAAVNEPEVLKKAGVEFDVIGKADYNLDKLMQFDVIGVGVEGYDFNADLKANFKVVNDYVENGGYLVTLDFQQDSTWNKDYLPHSLALMDPDLEDNVGVKLADHDIFKKPNKITDAHFGAGIWGAGDFMADGPHEAPAPWVPLVTDKQNNWPMIVGAEAGKGYVVLNSLQILQSIQRTGKKEVIEVLENFLFWRGSLAEILAVHPAGKIAVTWAEVKRSRF
jgi:hypothetical protein